MDIVTAPIKRGRPKGIKDPPKGTRKPGEKPRRDPTRYRATQQRRQEKRKNQRHEKSLEKAQQKRALQEEMLENALFRQMLLGDTSPKPESEPEPESELDPELLALLEPSVHSKPRRCRARDRIPAVISSKNRHRRSVSQTYEQWLEVQEAVELKASTDDNTDSTSGSRGSQRKSTESENEAPVTKGPFTLPPIPDSWIHSYKTKHNHYLHKAYPWLQQDVPISPPTPFSAGLKLERILMRRRRLRFWEWAETRGEEARDEGFESWTSDMYEEWEGLRDKDPEKVSSGQTGEYRVWTDEWRKKGCKVWKWMRYDPLFDEDFEADDVEIEDEGESDSGSEHNNFSEDD